MSDILNPVNILDAPDVYTAKIEYMESNNTVLLSGIVGRATYKIDLDTISETNSIAKWIAHISVKSWSENVDLYKLAQVMEDAVSKKHEIERKKILAATYDIILDINIRIEDLNVEAQKTQDKIRALQGEHNKIERQIMVLTDMRKTFAKWMRAYES